MSARLRERYSSRAAPEVPAELRPIANVSDRPSPLSSRVPASTATAPSACSRPTYCRALRSPRWYRPLLLTPLERGLALEAR
jgi:hypothetical protein